MHRTILMTYKHKTHSVNAEGKTTSNADVDFYIDDVSFIYLDRVVAEDFIWIS